MSWSEVFSEGRFSVAVAEQTDIVTAGSSWVWVDCEMPQVTYRPMQLDTVRSSQSRGSRSGPLPGAVMPILSIKFPVPGQAGDYDLTTDVPVPMGLLAAALGPLAGGAGIAYQINGVAPSDANTVTLNTTTGKVGCLLAAATGGTGTAKLGWIKSLSGVGPYTAQLFEDLAVQPANNDERLPTKTLYPAQHSGAQAWTIRVCGEDATQDRRYVGFIPESATFAVEDDRFVCTIQGPCYAGEDLSNSSGGLQTLDDIQLLDAVTGSTRYTLGSQLSVSGKDVIGATLNNGSVDPNGSCGLADVSWTLTYTHHAVPAPSVSDLGIWDVIVRSVELTASVAVPVVSDYEAAAKENILTYAWANRAAVSLCCYHGTAEGKIMALRMSSGKVASYPERTMINGIEHWKATLRADHWSSDGASTDAGNKPYTVGLG